MDIDKYLEAIEILGLPHRFSMKKLKEVYRKKLKENHPDLSNDSKEEIGKIKYSYEILIEYLENYEISFEKKDIELNPNDFMKDKILNEWGFS